jgi:hypothetical protein
VTEVIDAVIKQIVNGVNWVTVFYIIFGLTALYIARLIGISPPHLLRDLLREVVELFTLPQMSRTAIDGAITLALIIMTIVVGLFCFMETVPSFLSIFVAGVEGKGQSVLFFIFMVFMLVIGGILSLWTTRR